MPEQATSERIAMLNVLWFKGDRGQQRYAEYVKAARPFIEAVGGQIMEAFSPNRVLIGEFDADLVFFVEYPNWAAFKQFSQDTGYREKALPIREQAIEKSLLIRCSPQA